MSFANYNRMVREEAIRKQELKRQAKQAVKARGKAAKKGGKS